MSLAVFLSGSPPHQGGRQPLASPWLVAAVRPVTMATMDQIMDYLFSFVELFSGFRGSDVCVCVRWQRARVWGESAEIWNSKWWISGLFASQRRRLFSPALKNLMGFYRVLLLLLLLLLFLFQIYFLSLSLSFMLFKMFFELKCRTNQNEPPGSREKWLSMCNTCYYFMLLFYWYWWISLEVVWS